eukprot:m51a1_g2935 hypothetical protein (466) ;mRNA; r:585844-587341
MRRKGCQLQLFIEGSADPEPEYHLQGRTLVEARLYHKTASFEVSEGGHTYPQTPFFVRLTNYNDVVLYVELVVEGWEDIPDFFSPLSAGRKMLFSLPRLPAAGSPPLGAERKKNIGVVSARFFRRLPGPRNVNVQVDEVAMADTPVDPTQPTDWPAEALPTPYGTVADIGHHVCVVLGAETGRSVQPKHSRSSVSGANMVPFAVLRVECRSRSELEVLKLVPLPLPPTHQARLAAESESLRRVLRTSVALLLRIAQACYGTQLTRMTDDVVEIAQERGAKSLPHATFERLAANGDIGLSRAVLERIPVSEGLPADPVSVDTTADTLSTAIAEMRKALGFEASLLEADPTDAGDAGLSRALAFALLGSDASASVIEAAWGTAEDLGERLRAVAEAFGVRVGFLESPERRYEFAAEGGKTVADVAVAWVSDRFAAVVGERAYMTMREGRREYGLVPADMAVAKRIRQ